VQSKTFLQIERCLREISAIHFKSSEVVERARHPRTAADLTVDTKAFLKILLRLVEIALIFKDQRLTIQRTDHCECVYVLRQRIGLLPIVGGNRERTEITGNQCQSEQRIYPKR